MNQFGFSNRMVIKVVLWNVNKGVKKKNLKKKKLKMVFKNWDSVNQLFMFLQLGNGWFNIRSLWYYLWLDYSYYCQFIDCGKEIR